MANTVKPYSEDGSKKQQVEQMFDNISGRYDMLNRLLSLGIDQMWRKRAIRLLAKDSPENIMDLATGTGDMLLQLAKSLPESQITGVDLSQGMLDGAEVKIKKAHLSDRITLQQGDAENLNFPDNSFDAVTVVFGVRNFENLEKGLSEIRRVLKPEGRLVVLEFSKPQSFPFAQIFKFYFKNILPAIGKLLSKDERAYSYLYESVQVFPERQDFINILTKTDYNSSKCIVLTSGICCIYTAIK